MKRCKRSKKKIISMMLVVFLLSQNMNGGFMPTVHAMKIAEEQPDKSDETQEEETQMVEDGRENPEKEIQIEEGKGENSKEEVEEMTGEEVTIIPEITEPHSLEDMSAELSGVYADCNLKSSSMYATKTLLVESDIDSFDTCGASNAIYFNGIYILSYDTIKQTEQAYETLSGLDMINRVEIDAVLDTGTAQENQEVSGKMERQPSALKKFLDSKQVVRETVAAIIDTGYTPGEGENGRILDSEYNVSSSGTENSTADDNGHGTRMGNIVLENTPDYVKLMPLKAANSQGKATIASTYLAIQKAIEQGVDLILISMNAKASVSSLLLTEPVQEAVNQGIQVIASAGNSSRDVMGITPSNIEEAIVVSAVEEDGTFAAYANYGDTVDYSSFGTYQGTTGTSNAAAYMCAAMAYCNTIGEPYEKVFDEYGADFGETGREFHYGGGLIAFMELVEMEDDKSLEEEIPEDGDEGEEEDGNLKTSGLGDGYTSYHNINGWFFVKVTKGTSTVTYRVTCSLPENNKPKQKISYSISVASGTNFADMGTNGTFYTASDGVEVLNPEWAASERLYVLPFSFKFKSFDGYTLAYASDNGTQTHVSGFTSNTITGWIDTNNTGMTLFAGDIHSTISVKYAANTYYVKYDGNGKTSGSMSNSSHIYDTEANLTANVFQRTGHEFAGWAVSKTGNVKYMNKHSVKNLTPIKGSVVTLYAKWNINTSTLKINPNGGIWNGSTAAQSFTQNYNTTKSIPLPTRPGYRFTGWTRTNTYGSMPSTVAAATYTYGATKGATDTLTASWAINTSTLKVNPNGGTWNGSTAVQSFIQNYNTTKSIPIPARPGYDFFEWVRSGTNGSMSSLIAAATYTYRSANGVTDTITAGWRAFTYTIEYDANGGTGSMVDKRIFSYDSDTASDGRKANLMKNSFVREYYSFIGWNTKADGKGTAYADEAFIKNLTTADKAVITLYAQWEKRLFNVAYSGNVQTSGTNMLEYNIWHGDSYIFRPNVFEKIDNEIRVTKAGVEYEVEQKYSFQGWGITDKKSYIIKSIENISAFDFYELASRFNAISSSVSDSNPYDEVQPLAVTLAGNVVKPVSGGKPAKEFINLHVVWDAHPIIVVEPQSDTNEDDGSRIENDTLFFYEGEEPTKEDLITHLTVTDVEDGDLLNKVKITKIEYRDGLFVTSDGILKKGRTMEWEVDIPEDYIFDTYYMEMVEDEILTHVVTYEVTDSVGNTTIAELPVMVKYNHYPEIEAPEVYYYFKEEANQGKITEDELIRNAEAFDIEDQNKIKNKLCLVDFTPQEFKMQTESKTEFDVRYEVTDALRKTTCRDVKVVVTDPDALQAETPISYVRYISGKYLDTLEPTSVWKEPENLTYLQGVLRNEVAMDTWYFTHEYVLEAQAWILEAGDGSWKKGQSANREFLNLFSECKQ